MGWSWSSFWRIFVSTVVIGPGTVLGMQLSGALYALTPLEQGILGIGATAVGMLAGSAWAIVTEE